MNSTDRITELQNRIAELPAGYISKKTINGKQYNYLQWKEAGKVKSKYLKADQVDYVIRQIDERKQLQIELEIELTRSESASDQADRLHSYINALFLSKDVSIGFQDYEHLITNDLFYVDKTEFIYDWWQHKDIISLITRPRRFGKTLNLSMLNCFFSNKFANRTELFQKLNVWNHKDMHSLQGSFPVISISLSCIKPSCKEDFIRQLAILVQSAYWEHEDILPLLSPSDQAKFSRYMGHSTDDFSLSNIASLCKLLYKAYGKKVILLIDEYDTPMIEAWSQNCWDECSTLMREFFNLTLKNNAYIERALLTGITRISKESFFSDMNNFTVYSLTSPHYEDAFGFTEEEVRHALSAQGLTDMDGVKRWYNGFTIGSRTDIYNPWSITYYLREHNFKPYWVNTSSNSLLDHILMRGDARLKEDLHQLLKGSSIYTNMAEETPFQHIYDDNTAFWSMLFASGYVKIISISDEANPIYELAVTNYEVSYCLNKIVKHWFSESSIGYNEFITSLLSFDTDFMTRYLNRISRQIFSYYDMADDEPERFYHGLVLGMTLDLENRFIITSNRESGLGRYDVILEPRDPAKDSAFILEFKVYRPRREGDITESANEALKQIAEKAYDTSLLQRGIKKDNIHTFGIAFHGKEVWVEGK